MALLYTFIALEIHAIDLNCLKKSDQVVIGINQELVFNSEKCNLDTLKDDIVKFSLNQYKGSSLIEFEVVDSTIGSAHQVLNTDHTTFGGSTYYPAEDLLKVLDFYSGKFEIKPLEKVSIAKSVIEVTSTDPSTGKELVTQYSHQNIVLFDKDQKILILLRKLTSKKKIDL